MRLPLGEARDVVERLRATASVGVDDRCVLRNADHRELYALVRNDELQDALNKAVTALTGAGAPPLFGLTIVDLTSASDSGKSFASAGWNQGTEHYAASMLKVACSKTVPARADHPVL